MVRFGFLLVALIAITAWILAKGFTSADERQAILISAVLAAAVQMVTFGIVRYMGRHNAALAGWGIGAVLRMMTLILYGFIFVRLLGLPLTAALVSFAVFLFAAMLLESFLISYAR